MAGLGRMQRRPRQGDRRQSRRDNGEAAQDREQDAQTPHGPNNMSFLAETANHYGVTSGGAAVSRAMPGIDA